MKKANCAFAERFCRLRRNWASLLLAGGVMMLAANAPGLGTVDFGAVAIQFLRNACRGTGVYSREKAADEFVPDHQHPVSQLHFGRGES